MATSAVITSVQGQAWMVGADGARIALRPGMRIPADANIVTADGARVVLDVDGQGQLAISGDRQFLLGEDVARADVDPSEAAVQPESPQLTALAERLISGEDPFTGLDETAAVLVGSGGEGGSSFTRLLSVVEPTTPLALAYPRPGVPVTEDVRLGGLGGPGAGEQDPAPIPAEVRAIGVPNRSNEDGELIDAFDLTTYFSHSQGAPLTYEATGLPPGLSVDPGTGRITGTLDRSASQGGTGGTYTVTVTVTDPAGNTTTTTFDWSAINPPPLAVDDDATTEENTVVTGNVLLGKPGTGEGQDSDPDNDPLTVTQVTSPNGTVPAGQPVTGDQGGQFIIYPDGSYEFDPGTTFDYLKPGETAQTQVTYTISDGEGGTDTAVLIITITGTDDAPVFSGSDQGAVTEDVDVESGNVLRERGTLKVEDADAGESAIDTSVAPVASTGALGSLTIDADGNWTYTVDNAQVQDMNKDVVRQETFTVRSVDGTTHDIVITITGTNDAPVITSDDSQHRGAIVEDAADNTAEGTLTYEDIDLGHSITWTIQGSTTGQYGSIVLDQNGQWVYTLDNDSAATNALKAGESVTETFMAVVTDEHGASDTQELVITITGNTDGNPTITPEDGNGAVEGHVSVHERGLTGEDTSHISQGTITVEALDGLKSVQITTTAGVHTLDVAALQALSAGSPVVLNVNGGTLTLTGFTTDASVGGVPTQGTLSYTYELSAALDHSGPGQDEALTLNIPVGVTDVRDVQNNGTLVVQVQDDVPVAKNDANAVTEGLATEPAPTATGNVLVRDAHAGDVTDRQGADGAEVVLVSQDGGVDYPVQGGFATLVGQYGTLVIGANGQYTYTLDKDNADINALKDGETREEAFTYTIRDQDGDEAAAVLTITIDGKTDGDPTINPVDGNGTVDGHATVHEKGVGDDADDSERTSGIILVTAGDGLTSVTVGDPAAGGRTFTVDELENLSGAPVTIDVGHGTLVITGFTPTASVGGVPTAGELSYTYTLKDVQTHDPVQGENGKVLDVPLAVKDAGGGENNGTLHINVLDDVPVAEDDRNEVPAGSYEAVSGKLMANDREGVDQDVVVTKVVFGTEEVNVPATGTVSIDGTHGKLVVDAQGNYTYTRNPGGSAGGVDDVFTYTIRDNDGDTSDATLTVSIGDEGPTILDLTPAASGGELSVHEKHLADGTDPDAAELTQGGTFQVKSPDGIGSLTVGGVAIITDNAAVQDFSTTPLDIPTGLGNTLTITGYDPATGVVTYTYTLKDNTTTHTGAQDEQLFDNLPVVLTDMDGDEATGTLSVRVVDDVPTVTVDGTVAAAVTVDETHLGAPATASLAGLFTALFGADGQAGANASVYTLEVAANNLSGLVDTLTGAQVRLYLEDGKVVGYAGDQSAAKVLEVSIDAATGAVTLTQLRAVKHDIAGDQPAQHDDAASMAAGAVSVRLTVRDADGDESSAAAAVGDRLVFKDDGPAIAQNDADLTKVDGLTVFDAQTPGAGSSTASASFAGVFSVDGDETSAGNDGQQGDIAWQYALTIGSTDAGITSAGQSVSLSLVGQDVVGRAGGKDIFRVSVNAQGVVTLTQYEAIDHADGTDAAETLALGAGIISLEATATITDGDGDRASAKQVADIGGKLVFTDHGPAIGNPADVTVYERYLPTGSEAADAPTVVATGTLGVSFGADVYAGSTQSTYFTNSGADNTLAALNGLNLTSGNVALSYKLSDDGHTITATAGTDTVFTIAIENASSNPSYRFTLHQALDHADNAPNHVLNLPFTVRDADGDTLSAGFSVTVVDDLQGDARSIVVDEDGEITFNTTADGATSGVTVPATGQPGGPSYGTVTVDPDTGRITYTPNPDYSGQDTFTYTTVENGVPQNTVVTVTVNPIADAPTLVAEGVQTNEDTVVPLDLKVPVVTDNNDQNDAQVGDSPERLGLISLTFTKSGETVPGGVLQGVQADGQPFSIDLAVAANSSVQILIVKDDGSHGTLHTAEAQALADAGGSTVLKLTETQYQNLQYLPQADDGRNVSLKIDVTSYEVDESGSRLREDPADSTSELLPGAPASETVLIDVLAVTDKVALSIGADGAYGDSHAATVNEDGTINIAGLLKVDYPDDSGDAVNLQPDHDGSETRWFVITGLPKGAFVNGKQVTEISDGVWGATVQAPDMSDGTGLPDLNIRPPQHFSGDLGPITVTLYTQDSDADSTVSPAIEHDSVTLTLHVKPVADNDVQVRGVTGDEDSYIAFLANTKLLDIDGSQVVNAFSVEIPKDWTLWTRVQTGVDGAGQPVYDYTQVSDGSAAYTLALPVVDGQVDLVAAAQTYVVKPPAHSSVDATFDVVYTTTDTQVVNGEEVVHRAEDVEAEIAVQVRPVAERVGGDTDGNTTDDLTMMGDHAYGVALAGQEDSWFALNQGVTLTDGWSNEDGDERIYALLTPFAGEGQGGTAAIGAQFTWDGGSATYTGTAIRVPLDKLDTLQFKAPPHASGVFNIRVEALTVDPDPEDPTYDARATSGEAWLTGIHVAPVADPASLAVNPAHGKEDTAIALVIRPSSADKSETFNVQIDQVPGDAVLHYGGQEITKGSPDVVLNPDGSWSVVLKDFNPATPLTITPPADSNEDITLKVSVQSVDGPVAGMPGDESGWTEQTVVVRVEGVADPVEITTPDTPPQYIEDTLDAAGNRIPLGDLLTDVALTDVDTSERLSLTLTGLPAEFSVVGAQLINNKTGEAREWQVPTGADGQPDWSGVRIVTPPHYSGEVKVTVKATSTENDGHSRTQTQELSAVVTPSPEGSLNLSSSIVEDQATALQFSLVSPDASESLVAVHVLQADADATDRGYVLAFGGKTLAEALDDGDITLVDGYYRIEASQFSQLTAQADPNFAHNLPGAREMALTVRPEVADEADDGTAGVVTVVRDDVEHVLNVTPVTDAIALATDTPTPADITALGTLDYAFTIQQANDADGQDVDGSEQLIGILVKAPVGLLVDGVTIDGTTYNDVSYVGEGAWEVRLPAQSFTSTGFTGTLHLSVSEFLQDSDAHEVTLTAVSRDQGASSAEHGSVTWTVASSLYGDGPGQDPAIAELGWARNTDFVATEDVPFTLGDAYTATVEVAHADGVAQDVSVSFVIDNLPAGTTLTTNGSGVTLTRMTGPDGETETWLVTSTISGTTDAERNAALEQLLDSITVTPPANWNNEIDGGQDGLPVEVRYTAYLDNGSQDEVSPSEPMNVPVTPVTDPGQVTVSFTSASDPNAPAVEGDSVRVLIDVTSPADHGDIVLGNKLYLTLDESGFDGAEPGTWSYNGQPLVKETVSGDDLLDGMTAGEYYVVDLGAGVSVPLALTYTPAEDARYKAGSLTVEAWAEHRETGAADDDYRTASTAGEVVGQLETTNNGFEFVDVSVDPAEPITAITVRGNENSSNAPSAAILLPINGRLLDNDGSETVTSAVIEGLPVGFLVYVGGELATNLGGTGGVNSWSLPVSDGQLSADIRIQPPQHWAGSLDGLTLSVVSGEVGAGSSEVSTLPFTLEVTAVADGIDTFNPAPAFGVEGELIALNLNLAMKDNRPASAEAPYQDESLETATVQLQGLGQYAAFYVDATGGAALLSADDDRVSYDEATDVYTLSGLSQAEVDSLSFVQAANAADSTITVKAWTVDGDSTTEDAPVEKTFNLTLRDSPATSGDDTLIYGGIDLNGGAGEDTVMLRFGEDLDFGDATANHAAKLSNIEVLDLTQDGYDHRVENLGLQDVLDMTDDHRELTILADNGDAVSFRQEDGWQQVDSTKAGFKAYEAGTGADKATVYISDVAGVDIANKTANDLLNQGKTGSDF